MLDMTQRRTCGVKLDEAEELLIGTVREGMSQPMHFWWSAVQRGGRVRVINVTNDAARNRFRKHNRCIYEQTK